MYRPPRQSHWRGGGGGFAPPASFPQNPSFLPLPQFQNPSLPQPQFQNPSFVQSYSPYVQSPNSRNPSVGMSRQEVLEKAEAAAARAHRELVTAGESVSAWKVSQAALLHLKVDSWALLGLQLQDIPALHRLIITEGKVNAFIHCFVGARRITSLYDLETFICKNEGVERFEELGLGPLCQQPLAVHYFSIPPYMVEVFKITSEDIITCLRDFMDKHKRKIMVDEFLGFLAEQKSVSAKEKLCVRIQSLGLHVSYIRKADIAERATLSKSFEVLTHNSDKGRGREGMTSCQPSDTYTEKKALDRRYGSISRRMKSFSSAWGGFGKHIRFDSSSEDGGDDEDDQIISLYQNSTHNKDGGQRVNSCPYPSTTEEMVRLGLKSEIGENASPCDGKVLENGGRKSSCKKRKFEEKNCNASFLHKLPKKEEAINLEGDQKKSADLVLSSSDIEMFIATWKEACRENSVGEVLSRMMNFYIPTAKKHRRTRKMFSLYPGVGLLNVAVASIKCGMLDSLYDTFQAFGEHEFVSAGSAHFEKIETAPSIKKDAVLNTNTGIDELGVTVEDIIEKISEFFDSDRLATIERGCPLGRHFACLKKFLECENWLTTQFSAKEFSSLGHGNFYGFLERHASLLPNKLHNYLNGDHEQSCVEVSMIPQQLGVLLSQAESNLMNGDTTSKYDISMLLKTQFPTISFHIVGNEPEKYFTDLIKGQKDSENTNCVLFSSALLGKYHARNSLVSSGRPLSEASQIMVEAQQAPFFGTVSFKDAIQCLLKAPMLLDLLSWSHWDLIYAPSLGPLLDWLSNDVHDKELLCIATNDGKIVKIDPSATLDEFLDAMIQCSPYQVALKLLSLLCLYGGMRNTPLSLLKCYAQRAIDVLMRNCVDLKGINTGDDVMHINPSNRQISADKDSISNPLSDGPPGAEAINQGSVVCGSFLRVNKVITIMSKFILECLSLLPSEFWSFAAEILVLGLRSFNKDAPSLILHLCSETSQRVMLHDIGLSLGITEWIEDYHQFSSLALTDLYKCYKTLNSIGPPFSASGVNRNHTPDPSDKHLSNNGKMHVSVVADASLTDGKQKLACERHANATLTDDYCRQNNKIWKRDGAKEVTNDNSDMSDDGKAQDSTMIIESIRREEFGLDPNLNSTDIYLLKKQHARLGRALHCLSQELYSQDSHLLLELVQNADDNSYSENVEPTLVFILQDTGIVVLNNEQGFSAQNIRALCDIGNSTKKGSTAGYIGHKGIGFKSVFRVFDGAYVKRMRLLSSKDICKQWCLVLDRSNQVTDAPEIHSNGFNVKFDITEGQIGFVLPTVISPCDSKMFRQILSGEDDESCGTPWNTCILLPFKLKFKEEAGMRSIISMFSDLHPSLLLFLHRLRCIKFKNMLEDTLVVMQKETSSDGIIKVSHGKEKMSWLVVSKKLHASVVRSDVQSTEIAMAFTLQESMHGEYKPHLSQQPVFSFLPLRNYGLKFILQGDFVLPSSREEVDGNSAWNQWLLSEFPALFVNAEQSFCALSCFHKNPGKAVTAYMSFVPLVGEVHGFFSYLPHMIISKLRMSNCLLLDGPGLEWVLPCRVLRGWDEQARLLVSDSLLQEHLGLGYLHQDVILSDMLTKALGVQDYGPKVLVDIISSLSRKNDGIKSLLGLGWLSSWFGALYSTLLVHSSGYPSRNDGLEQNVIGNLKRIPFIPLSDGSYSSLADGPIWLPCDVFSHGFESKQSPRDFPTLYAKLRTINPLLFCAATTNERGMEDTSADNLIRMLRKIGVQELSAHEVIRSHILVALTDDKHSDDNKDLMIEYLTFIMLHFQYECTICCSEKAEIMSKLRTKPILLTNHGYRCPADEPIHFGREYGNLVDIFKLIDPVYGIWLEVDGAYLEHPSTRLLPLVSTRWREFFLELGVTDFVKVNHVDKNVSEVLNAFTGTQICGRDLTLTAPYVIDWESPELVQLLSTLSSKKYREKCIYLLEVLDKMWDDCYAAKARLSIGSQTFGDKKTIESSFMRSIREFRWIASTLDEELHHSKDLFYNCEDVRSILGMMAPYAVPQVTSKLLLEDIGFKTEVSLDDALAILHSWRISRAPLMASTAQMLKFYTFISNGLAVPKLEIFKDLISTSFIFIPYVNTSGENVVVSGVYLSPKEVYWHDPAGCIDRAIELILLNASEKGINIPPSKALAAIYPSLYDFFVNVCGVPHAPPFGSYIEILLQLKTNALPSQAAYAVFRVLSKWADDLSSGLVKSEEILNLKENLLKLENAVLPALHDKWVSLHPSFGLICWSDDEELKQQFKHSDGVYFLQFGELSDKEQEILSGKVSVLLQALGIPALSEVVSREAIFYGSADNSEKASLINWVLPFAQRYLYKLYPKIYLNLKQLRFEKLSQLQVVAVEKLFYKHTLKGRDSNSKKRFECTCLLQGNLLYATRSSDSHSMFLALSRFFLNGSAELHLANFLHMVTTMAESGSTSEQMEFFIVNSQKIPRLPNDEPIWSLAVHEGATPQLICAPPMNTDQNISASRRKPGISPNWPPTDWKTAPDFQYAQRHHQLTRPEPALSAGPQIEVSKLLEDVDHVDFPVPIEVDGDWVIEEGLTMADKLLLHESVMTPDQASSLESFDSVNRPVNSLLKYECEFVGESLADLPTSPGRENLCLQTIDGNQLRKTGRLGEIIAYRYFAEKLGSGKVKWVNEETETGLPYDLITRDQKGNREYVEVKATRSANKHSFLVTTREWQFAVQMGDSFSIAHVLLLARKEARITILKNPIKLCQQKALHLAVVMSKQLRDS